MSPPTLRRERVLTAFLLALTTIATVLASVEIARIGFELAMMRDWTSVAAQSVFAVAFAMLTYGFFVYFVTRLSYLQRLSAHVPVADDTLDAIHALDAVASLTVLIPSYKEEAAIVFRTLLSAGVQTYPRRRVVLLIDDPDQPADAADALSLAAMRRLPSELDALFTPIAERLGASMEAFAARCARGSYDPRAEAAALCHSYEEAAAWFDAVVDSYQGGDHGDRLMAARVLAPSGNAHRARAARLARLGKAEGIDASDARVEHARLAALFRVEFASFERKRYVNLSHEANKAMNLNSYLGLIGKSFVEVREASRLELRETARGLGTLDIPDAQLVLCLDADSILLPDYALRLAHVMHAPGNERLAVVQTPYSAFPGAPRVLERVAGATTDIQYLIHQGFTGRNATFWVGANALLRKSALDDICTLHEERGYPVPKYIQDRTVIEDTESSIDLADRGWRLYNYPDRLAYSATPPDFGALLIQRRRWANGGLIILPKALRYLCRGPQPWRKAPEAFCRIHYLTSVAIANVALLVVLFGSFERNAGILWLPLCGLPYMYVYARDLVLGGYRWSDFLRVYALNLLLVPIHLGGALKSLHQATTGVKTPFARTPKVIGRTAAPATYVLIEYGLLTASAAVAIVHAVHHEWASAAFASVYTAFSAYAVVGLMGWQESLTDLRLAWRLVVAPKRQPIAAPPEIQTVVVGDALGTGNEAGD